MSRSRPGKNVPTARATRPRRATKKSQVRFANKLVLNQWVLSLFNAERFEDLAEYLRDEVMEGLDENNVHRFHSRAHGTAISTTTQLPAELLLEYDQHIVKHTKRLERTEDHPRR